MPARRALPTHLGVDLAFLGDLGMVFTAYRRLLFFSVASRTTPKLPAPSTPPSRYLRGRCSRSGWEWRVGMLGGSARALRCCGWPGFLAARWVA